MGLFSSKKSRERAAEIERLEAAERGYAQEARDEARTADKYRQNLASGKSQDPAADRYMIRQHEENRRLAAANAHDFRTSAKAARRWF